MARSGFERGFNQGILQGVKTGLGMGNMRCGYVAGRTDGTVNNDKHQDPENLVGDKIPVVHWNAENCTVNASNNLLTITNLSNRVGASTISVLSDPNRAGGDVYGTKSALTFDATDAVFGGTLNGSKECTIVLVFSINTTSLTDLFTHIFGGTTQGDIYVRTIGGNQIQTEFYGTGGSSNISSWNTRDNLIQGEWYILTAKFRTYTLTGPGTEQEVFINGTKQNIIPVTTTFGNGSTNDSFQAATCYFGGNSTQFRGGNEIASALVFNYWLNETEQIRIENYLKQYYGYKF